MCLEEAHKTPKPPIHTPKLFTQHIPTKIRANSGNGATVPPTTVATVPSEAVVTKANASAATGELMTTGNCSAIRTQQISAMPYAISTVSTTD